MLSNLIYEGICVWVSRGIQAIQYKSHVEQTRFRAGTRLDQPILQANIGVGLLTLFLSGEIRPIMEFDIYANV